ncbi:MAG: biopolymer transporter ExbD [Flavobacteriales bacterium]|nr:biopolymer transporter ExbD [Flavobacteriales bacterium]MCB9178159.1 biopolymer transporter ExbD [Flavobacteriales bacterium]HPF91942.1 biopolymer transporter ExbD [Flavobacteriales bacterium]
MSKIKMPKSSPNLDMTPMVDLAFLLVTFFMLTAQFRPEEAVAVDTPSSMSQSPIPMTNMMTIVVDTAGKVFWDFTDKGVRIAVLEELGKRVNYEPTQEEKIKFVNAGPIGVPIQDLKALLALETGSERKDFMARHEGIPVDSTNNQLRDWIMTTRNIFWQDAGQNPIVALKADGNTNYSRVAEVIRTFQSPGIMISKFKMITDLEASRM